MITHIVYLINKIVNLSANVWKCNVYMYNVNDNNNNNINNNNVYV